MKEAIKVNFPLTGEVKLELFDRDGNLKVRRVVKNTFMDAGKNHVADQLSDKGEAQMGYMAIGTSGTAFTASDTALHSELDRNALNAGYPEQNGNQVIYKAYWGTHQCPLCQKWQS